MRFVHRKKPESLHLVLFQELHVVGREKAEIGAKMPVIPVFVYKNMYMLSMRIHNKSWHDEAPSTRIPDVKPTCRFRKIKDGETNSYNVFLQEI
jgi:hypothetical protein